MDKNNKRKIYCVSCGEEVNKKYGIRLFLSWYHVFCVATKKKHKKNYINKDEIKETNRKIVTNKLNNIGVPEDEKQLIIH